MQSSVDLAVEWLAKRGQPAELASEHLLLGLLAADHEVAQWLGQHGLSAESIEIELHRLHGHLPKLDELIEGEPIGEPIDEPIDLDDLPCDPSSALPAEPPRDADADAPVHAVNRLDQIGVLRVVDAAANRAREGLRVVEDYVRFVLDDKHLTEHFKRLRHELTAALEPISIRLRLAARETQADVGTGLSTEGEIRRDAPCSVLTANFCRLQESLRTLEEFTKLIDSRLAAAFEQLRYRSYTLQRAVEVACDGRERLADARLYVLLDGQATPEDFQVLARDLVLAGVDVIQLRDKRLDDRTLLERARLLREITQGSETLFVMNDRPDLALLARADGVHVGQEELPLKEVRSLVGAGTLIGVSVHSIEQARAAVLDGANYLGVGPTFPSGTKQFDQFPGPELLAAVAAEISLPAFAIGGIDRDNVVQVLATGIRRIAVSSAVITSDNPSSEATWLKSVLRG
ncbi:MAG TPA: thiamine phosphate synthase [Planctomycetaceae bacterium]|nr:thiamine phosphate synthase [Planctomycetaceae bacterium]